MSKNKEYRFSSETIAAAISDASNVKNYWQMGETYHNGVDNALEFIASRLAVAMAADDPHFDRERFMTACGL